MMEGYGVSSGSLHWDLNVIFEYDFDKGEYKSIAANDYGKLNMEGVTADSKYLIYIDNNEFKKIELSTGIITDVERSLYSGAFRAPFQWNDHGFCY